MFDCIGCYYFFTLLDFFADLKDINRQSHTYTHSNNDNDVKTTQENLACQY